MKTLTINLPDNLGIEEFEAKMLFAGQLHAKGKITLGQAADIVGISKRAFGNHGAVRVFDVQLFSRRFRT